MPTRKTQGIYAASDTRKTARDYRTSQAINGSAERTCSPRPVRCEWHWGERDRILPCDADALFVNRWHDQMAPCRDEQLLRAASRAGAAFFGGFPQHYRE